MLLQFRRVSQPYPLTDPSAFNIPPIPPTTAVLQKFCKQAILIEQVSVPFFENGRNALKFPMLPVGLSMGGRLGAVHIHEFVVPLSDNVLKNCRTIQKFGTARKLGNCGFKHLKNSFYRQVY